VPGLALREHAGVDDVQLFERRGRPSRGGVRTDTSAPALWIRALLERRPARIVTVAMANKTARIAWAVLARGDVYRAPTMA
jgi:hypothetical protein